MDTLYHGKNEEIYKSFSVNHTTSVEPSHVSGSFISETNPRQQAFNKLVEQSSSIASVQLREFRVQDFMFPPISYHETEQGFKIPIRMYPKN